MSVCGWLPGTEGPANVSEEREVASTGKDVNATPCQGSDRMTPSKDIPEPERYWMNIGSCVLAKTFVNARHPVAAGNGGPVGGGGRGGFNGGCKGGSEGRGNEGGENGEGDEGSGGDGGGEGNIRIAIGYEILYR